MTDKEINDLFDNRIDWQTQSYLLHLLESSVLKDEAHTRRAIIDGVFEPEELRDLITRLKAHKMPDSEVVNPSQRTISQFIKKII